MRYGFICLLWDELRVHIVWTYVIKWPNCPAGEWKFPYWRSSLNRCCGLVGML